MGQANSRSSPAPHPSRPPCPSPAAPIDPSQRERSESTAPAATDSSKHSHRSFLGRTIRTLLPHSRSAQDAPSSHNPSSSLRKRWRSSRKLTKQPSSLSDLPEGHFNTDSGPDSPVPPHSSQDPIPEAHTVATVSPGAPVQSLLSPLPCAIVAHPSSNPSPLAHAPVAFSPLDPRSSSNQPESPDVLDSDSSPRLYPLPTTPEDELLTEQVERCLDDVPATHHPDNAFVQGSSQDGQSPARPASFTNTVPPSTVSQPSHNSLPDPQIRPPRHFQPPGPLVVVQGVVNTSDAAATQGPSSSRSSGPASLLNQSAAPAMSHRRPSSIPLSADERHGARNRLSALLLPRPTSMLGRRAPSAERGTPSYEYPSSGDASSFLPASSSSDLLPADLDTPSEDHRASDDSEGRHRPLSPGSIDVLGTLLSVAAAATAASLFSPSLGFQGNGDLNTPPPSGIPRPMSPTPTAGLGGGEGFSSLLGLDPSASPSQSMPVQSTQPREGRERIRTVWEGFRERLGLNRNSAASNLDEDSPPGSEDQGNMRPGEIMLAEMARALNIGLGLNGDGSSTIPERSSESTSVPDNEELSRRSTDNAPTGRPTPPEDSFERFLLNLQADLRVALSDGGSTGVSVVAGASDTGNERGNHADMDSDDASGRLPLFHELPTRVVDDQQSDDEELAPLEDVSDSEGEDEDEVFDDTESTRTPTPMPASSAVPPNRVDQSSSSTRARGEHGNADRAPPGINLWRLYRFQPIPASQVAGHAADTTSTSLPLSPPVPTSSIPLAPDTFLPPAAGSSSAASASPATPSDAGTSADLADTTLTGAPTPLAGDASQNMVVPVIVVGLQSVDMGQVHGHAHSPESDAMLPDSRDAHAGRRSRPTSASFDNAQRQQPSAPSLDSETSSTITPRERSSWQSRAATALRNLRPGRRNGSRGRRAAEGMGSRTFLIYVIGGYYPPNHHMVTGSDNLDSYEALWELAELLGQVKPPVATREDIDSSGLEIIQSSELEEYEREGKVASNCVERCLICLDDYDTADELRLMTCKHAFHKECVDRWLQVGRNNCPACRTKGVSTAGDTAP